MQQQQNQLIVAQLQAQQQSQQILMPTLEKVKKKTIEKTVFSSVKCGNKYYIFS